MLPICLTLLDEYAALTYYRGVSSKHFIRVNSNPASDLERGYSYPMGMFGDEEEAHAGLSGYCLESRGVADAIDALDSRMGLSGFGGEMYVSLFRGSDRGMGPDSEELFYPEAIVASWDLREIAGTDDLLDRLAALGFSDED